MINNKSIYLIIMINNKIPNSDNTYIVLRNGICTFTTGTTRQAASGRGPLAAASLAWPRLKWWRRLRSSRGSALPSLPGRSGTGWWRRACVGQTPFPVLVNKKLNVGKHQCLCVMCVSVFPSLPGRSGTGLWRRACVGPTPFPVWVHLELNVGKL